MAPKSVKKSNSILLLLLPFLFLSTACSPEYGSYANMQQIDKTGWQRLCAYSCEAPVYDSLSFYRIDVTGRLRYSCRLDSLSVIVQVTAPAGESFRDTLSFALAHLNDRIWKDFRFPWCSHVQFLEKGTWQFSFWHNMDIDVLTGVTAIGVYIEKEGDGKK